MNNKNNKLYWYNPFKKYPIISFINPDKTIYYTRLQILNKDLKYILYNLRKNIWPIIMFILTLIGIYLSV